MDIIMLAFVVIYYIMTNCFLMEARGLLLTKEDDLALEKQLLIINKPSIATITTEYGDIYDCVDFYKQPAFDHPLLKNHTFYPEMNYKHEKMHKNVSSMNEHTFKAFKEGDCPVGSVPIRRTTKADLIREKKYKSSMFQYQGVEPADADVALVQTREGYGPFTGAGMILSLFRPSVTSPQYSAVRLRIQNGNNDAIQIGVRVDPSLYGDDQLRLYTYFKTGQTQCFNTRCPGFVYVNTQYPLDYVFKDYYSGGKIMSETQLYVVRDNDGNWWLEVGRNNIRLGFWPAKIFSELNGLATYVDWGGEVHNVPNQNLVNMGLGSLPNCSPEETAFCRVLSVLTPDGKTNDPAITTSYANNPNYKLLNINYADDYYRHAIFYGGPAKYDNNV